MVRKERKYLRSTREVDTLLALIMRKDVDSLPEDFNWNLFDALVRKNTLMSQVLGGIKYISPEIVQGNAVLAEYQSMQSYFVARSMNQMKVLASLAAKFEKRGIRVISLKGPLLAMELYGNPSQRFSGDLDFYVDPAKHDEACRCLEELGFAIQPHKTSVFDLTPKRQMSRALSKMEEEKHSVYVNGDVTVELHQQISIRMEGDFDLLWEQSRAKMLLGQTVHCLGEIDNIIYLLSHASGHEYQRLSWLMDLYILLTKPSVSIEALYREMSKRGLGMLLVEVLMLLYRKSAVDMPVIRTESFAFVRNSRGISVFHRLKNNEDFVKGIAMSDCVAPRMYTTKKSQTIASRRHAFLLPVVKKKQTIFTFLHSFIAPCEADLELINLPDSLFFIYYIIRPFHFIWRKMPFYKADKRR